MLWASLTKIEINANFFSPPMSLRTWSSIFGWTCGWECDAIKDFSKYLIWDYLAQLVKKSLKKF
jgi:hypothetical protein